MTQNAKAAEVRTHGKPLLKRIWDYRVIYLMLLPVSCIGIKAPSKGAIAAGTAKQSCQAL